VHTCARLHVQISDFSKSEHLNPLVKHLSIRRVTTVYVPSLQHSPFFRISSKLDPQVVSQVPTYAQIICMRVSCHCAVPQCRSAQWACPKSGPVPKVDPSSSSSCDLGCIFGKLCSVAPLDSAPQRAGALGWRAANERQRLTIRWRAAGDRRASEWTNGRRGFGRAAGWTGGGGAFFMGVGCFCVST
jgi:hypothetical protein